jgi:hypothetical protein
MRVTNCQRCRHEQISSRTAWLGRESTEASGVVFVQFG